LYFCNSHLYEPCSVRPEWLRVPAIFLFYFGFCFCILFDFICICLCLILRGLKRDLYMIF
jgi:hypothetical protein